jgi:hypothetical protein
VEADTTVCLTLGLSLLVGPVEHYAVALRVARDPEGRDLVPTDLEARRTAEAARDAAHAARDAAVARVRELEKQLAERPRRRGGDEQS